MGVLFDGACPEATLQGSGGLASCPDRVQHPKSMVLYPFLCFINTIVLALGCSPQMRGDLLRERHKLTLFKSPIRTLYYFSKSAWSGLTASAHWVASHPVTLFILLPALALYMGAKHSGQAPGVVEAVEVGVLLAGLGKQGAHAQLAGHAIS